MPKRAGSGKIERIKTGIPGLDNLIEGGFIPGSSILVMGGPGTGKTIFCYQFLWEGLKNGEPVLFVSFENDKESMINEAADFGFKFDGNKKFEFIHIQPEELVGMEQRYEDIANSIIERIFEAAKRIGAKRIAIDSLTVFSLFLQGDPDYRRRIYDLMQKLGKLNATVVFTTEREVTEEGKEFGTETYAVDGLVMLYYTEIGAEQFGNIEIRKMRRTNHKHGLFPTKITSRGLEIRRKTN